MELQRTWNNQSTILKKTNKVGIFRVLNFKNYYKTTIIIKSFILMKRQTHKSINRIENSEINLYIYDQIIHDKSAKMIHRERKIFSTNTAKSTGYRHRKKNEYQPSPHTTHKC